MARRLLYSVILICCFVSACGVKSSPRPPIDKMPERVSRVETWQKEDGIILRWKAPETPAPETKFTAATSFQVERREKKTDEAEWGEFVILTSVPLPEKSRRLEWKDTSVKVGYFYEYRVVALDANGVKSGYSKPVISRWDTPPGAPLNVVAEGSDKMVTLKWDSPDTEAKIEGYFIYRMEEDGDYSSLTGTMVVPVTEYSDIGLKNGVRYRYYITAAGVAGTYLIEGPPSAVVEVVPLDKIAPRVPVNVAAFVVQGGVRVTWLPNLETDLAGYHIFRAYRGKTERLTKSPIKEAFFIDTSATRAGHYSYSVTAIDNDGNESVKSEWGEVFVK